MSRPIDADALRERLQNLAYDDWNQGITTSFADACNEIIDIVEEQPTIEPRKGKWIKHIDDLFPAESTIECDQCHEHQPLTIDDNFCPFCGADMRGDSND